MHLFPSRHIPNSSLNRAIFSKFQTQKQFSKNIWEVLPACRKAILFLSVIYLLLLAFKWLSDYIGREFEVQIVETKPEDAVNIIECDMNVDFEAPVGYKGTSYFLIYNIFHCFSRARASSAARRDPRIFRNTWYSKETRRLLRKTDEFSFISRQRRQNWRQEKGN